MNRLTEKLNKEQKALFLEESVKCDYKEKDNIKLTSVVDKLGQLEDIEEELGIDLTTLFKAFKNGFYGIDKDGSIKHFAVEHYVPFLKGIHTNGIMLGTERRYKLCDYGKTWALTKEELEKKGE